MDKVRETKSPHVEIVHTFRLGPHSKGDDDRPIEEINKWTKKDPLIIAENYLEKNEIKKIESAVKNQILKAEEKTRTMSY